MNCQTCKYWNPEPYRLTPNGQNSADPARTLPAGTCRLDSPWVGINNFRTWPVTVQSDWCHKWTPKEEDKVKEPTPEPHIVVTSVPVGPYTGLSVPTDLTGLVAKKRGRKKSS